MFREISLDDKTKITYMTMPIHVRSYYFTYERWNGIKQEASYDIELVNMDYKNYFRVQNIMCDIQYFETYNEAEAYILKKFSELREQLRDEDEKVQAFLMTSNKKGRKKKHGNNK